MVKKKKKSRSGFKLNKCIFLTEQLPMCIFMNLGTNNINITVAKKTTQKPRSRIHAVAYIKVHIHTHVRNLYSLHPLLSTVKSMHTHTCMHAHTWPHSFSISSVCVCVHWGETKPLGASFILGLEGE